MKKLYPLLVFLLITASVIGQVPSGFKYQAVLRNLRGELKANTDVIIGVDILQGSATGISVYSERHNIKTDSYGLINIEIGKGTSTIGTLSVVDWGTGIYYIKVTVDGLEMGTSQLLSVPYALFAKKAGNGFSGSYNDLLNKPVLFDGTWSGLSGKPVFATVASSGSYNDLTNKPVIFSGAWASLTGKPTFAAVATSGSYNDLTNKPVLFNGTWANLTGKPTTISGYGITDAFNGTWASLTGKPVFATVATSGVYSDLTGKPTRLSNFINDLASFSGNWIDILGKPAFSTVATSGNYNDLINKPILFNGTWTSLTGKPTTISGYGITDAFNGTWTSLTGKPTTISGYGITDAFNGTWASLSGKPTTISGYGITDAFNGTWTSLTGKPTTISGYGITDAFNGTWASLTGKPVLATVATSGNYNDLTNRPAINGSETKIMAGTNVTVTGTGTISSPYVINSIGGGGGSTHYLGEVFGGGVIFHVYRDGSGQEHGLIVSLIDQGGAQWGLSGIYVSNCESTWNGSANTTAIINAGCLPSDAAGLCKAFSAGGFSDWYLPSVSELNMLWNNLFNVNKTLNSEPGAQEIGLYHYWSSTQGTQDNAWPIRFSSGGSDYDYVYTGTPKSGILSVRAIRAF